MVGLDRCAAVDVGDVGMVTTSLGRCRMFPGLVGLPGEVRVVTLKSGDFDRRNDPDIFAVDDIGLDVGDDGKNARCLDDE